MAVAATASLLSVYQETPSKKASRGVFKKVVKYFQDQALEQSQSSLYLSPRGKEPQQRRSQREPDSRAKQNQAGDVSPRRFSEATTCVNSGVNHHRQHQRATPLPPITSSSRSSSVGGMSSQLPSTSRYQYASDNILQSYDLFVPEQPSEHTHGTTSPPTTRAPYWVVYIHGGYFRDVKVDSTSFKRTIQVLESDTSSRSTSRSSHSKEELETGIEIETEIDRFPTRDRFAGYASINYRLSPHPAYPQDANRTPTYEMRDAAWPDQLNDVLAALRHLQARHHFGSNYILAGHSVGATLAFLAALECRENGIEVPRGVVGVSGIYDFPRIHHTNPTYEEMTKNAIKDRALYDDASPALRPFEEYKTKWISALSSSALDLISDSPANPVRTPQPRRRPAAAVLAHSKDDGLVDWGQLQTMERLFTPEDDDFVSHVVELKGEHDRIWQEGRELARTLNVALDLLSDV